MVCPLLPSHGTITIPYYRGSIITGLHNRYQLAVTVIQFISPQRMHNRIVLCVIFRQWFWSGRTARVWLCAWSRHIGFFRFSTVTRPAVSRVAPYHAPIQAALPLRSRRYSPQKRLFFFICMGDNIRRDEEKNVGGFTPKNLSYGKWPDMEKFATLPHQLENAVRFPHFPQHDNDVWMVFLFFTPLGFAVSPLLGAKTE